MPKLSDTRIRRKKPRAKRFKLFEGEGFFMIVTPQGGRWWRQRYRSAGEEQSSSLGTYPETFLAKARDKGGAIGTLWNRPVSRTAAGDGDTPRKRDAHL